jgi:hypothetical protein
MGGGCQVRDRTDGRTLSELNQSGSHLKHAVAKSAAGSGAHTVLGLTRKGTTGTMATVTREQYTGADTPAVARSLDGLAVEGSWRSLSRDVVTLGIGERSQEALRMAFDYELLGVPGRKARGVCFGPSLVSDYSVYPGPVIDVAPEVADVWVRTAQHATGDLVVARLCHLLYELRRGDYVQYARRAAQAYLRLVAHGPDDQRVLCAGWAVEICEQIGELGSARSVLGSLEKIVVNALDNDNPHEAVRALRVGASAFGPTSGWANSELVVRAHAQCQELPEVRLDLFRIERLLSFGGKEELVRIEKASLKVLLAQGLETVSPVDRATTLIEVLERGRGFGISEAVSGAVEALGTLAPDIDFDLWEEYLVYPAKVIDAGLAPVLSAAGLSESLDALLASKPPRGDRFGDEVLVVAVDGDTQVRYVDRRVFDTRAVILGRGLDVVVAKWGPTISNVTEYLGKFTNVNEDTKASLAGGFVAYSEGRYEECALVALSRFETILREWCGRTDRSIYRPLRVEGGVGFAGPSTLMERLESGFEPSWYHFVNSFLFMTKGRGGGANYRNELMHGRVAHVTRLGAGLALLCSLYVAAA